MNAKQCQSMQVNAKQNNAKQRNTMQINANYKAMQRTAKQRRSLQSNAKTNKAKQSRDKHGNAVQRQAMQKQCFILRFGTFGQVAMTWESGNPLRGIGGWLQPDTSYRFFLTASENLFGQSRIWDKSENHSDLTIMCFK